MNSFAFNSHAFNSFVSSSAAVDLTDGSYNEAHMKWSGETTGTYNEKMLRKFGGTGAYNEKLAKYTGETGTLNEKKLKSLGTP